MELRPVRKLAQHDDLDGFDSGEPQLDNWLRKHAYSDQQARVSVTHVLTRGETVIGYYTIAPQSIMLAGGGDVRLGKGQPEGRPIPVYLLARLALDRAEHGLHLGEDLLRHALIKCVAGAENFGGRAVLVHAKYDKAAAFYRHYGFVSLPENPHHLYLPVKDIKKSVQEV